MDSFQQYLALNREGLAKRHPLRKVSSRNRLDRITTTAWFIGICEQILNSSQTNTCHYAIFSLSRSDVTSFKEFCYRTVVAHCVSG
jgi:hypothetical protein